MNSDQAGKTAEEIKPWPLLGYAPGSYMNHCAICNVQMYGVDKLCFMCLKCAAKEANKIISASLSAPAGKAGSVTAEEREVLRGKFKDIYYDYFDAFVGGYLLSVDKDKEMESEAIAYQDTYIEELKKEIAEGRFKLPTDKQVVEMAIIFNDGKIDHAKLSDMVGMCQFVIDRLYENGNISIPSSKEEK